METFSALLAVCAGNSPVPGEFPSQRPVTRSFDVFFDLRLDKRLSKQPWGWWFETTSHPLWRHRNDQWRTCNMLLKWVLSLTRIKSDLGNAYHLSLIVGFDHGLPCRVMMTSSSASIFCVTGPVSGEFTGHRGIPVTKACDAELGCFLCAWWNGWLNTRDAGDLRRHRAHYDVTVICKNCHRDSVTTNKL